MSDTETRNAFVLSACWVEQAALRYTPAGLPALDLTLEHRGEVVEAGHPRRVELQLRAVAVGALAWTAQGLPSGEVRLWTGFLAAGRNGKGVVMHITGIDGGADV